MIPRILDACCGGRMMWFDDQNPDAVFGDCRIETVTMTDRSHHENGKRVLRIEPDVTFDFRMLPYANEVFPLVVFDPPHLVRAGPRSWMRAKYGVLGPNWRDDLARGFRECLRVLTPDGVLIFKWAETQVPLSEVLALAPFPPLFGSRRTATVGTHWLVFMKPRESA